MTPDQEKALRAELAGEKAALRKSEEFREDYLIEVTSLRAALAAAQGALREIATPKPSVDMADPEEDQLRDALHAIGVLRYIARAALNTSGKPGGEVVLGARRPLEPEEVVPAYSAAEAGKPGGEAPMYRGAYEARIRLERWVLGKDPRIDKEDVAAVVKALDALAVEPGGEAQAGRVWGTCGNCPRDPNGRTYPHYCEHRGRYDHRLEWPIAPAPPEGHPARLFRCLGCEAEQHPEMDGAAQWVGFHEPAFCKKQQPPAPEGVRE